MFKASRGKKWKEVRASYCTAVHQLRIAIIKWKPTI